MLIGFILGLMKRSLKYQNLIVDLFTDKSNETSHNMLKKFYFV